MYARARAFVCLGVSLWETTLNVPVLSRYSYVIIIYLRHPTSTYVYMLSSNPFSLWRTYIHGRKKYTQSQRMREDKYVKSVKKCVLLSLPNIKMGGEIEREKNTGGSKKRSKKKEYPVHNFMIASSNKQQEQQQQKQNQMSRKRIRPHR